MEQPKNGFFLVWFHSVETYLTWGLISVLIITGYLYNYKDFTLQNQTKGFQQ